MSGPREDGAGNGRKMEKYVSQLCSSFDDELNFFLLLNFVFVDFKGSEKLYEQRNECFMRGLENKAIDAVNLT